MAPLLDARTGRAARLERVEGDPAVTGRWGPSVVLLPSGDLADALDRWTGTLAEQLGPEHWRSGALGSAHVTVRALQHWGAPATGDQVDALRRAATEPVTLAFTGFRSTDQAVLALAISPDGSGDRLRQRYAAELAEEGWLEDVHLPAGRDLWYVTLVHIAGPVRVTPPFAGHEELGVETFTAAHVCEWRFDEDGRRMMPQPVATVPLR